MDETFDIRKAIVDEFEKRLRAEPLLEEETISMLVELVTSGKKLKPEAFMKILESSEHSDAQD